MRSYGAAILSAAGSISPLPPSLNSTGIKIKKPNKLLHQNLLKMKRSVKCLSLQMSDLILCIALAIFKQTAQNSTLMQSLYAFNRSWMLFHPK